ncbi:MAG: DUF58 domain-containing protein [Phycisphaeraceae bacterium]
MSLADATTTGAPGTSRFLDLSALGALAHMRLVARRRIDGTFSGRHRSRQQGGAAEFADYREYSEGEDLRRLDWKVLARTGRAYIRLFQDETNLNCTLAIDASHSMLFAGAGAPSRKGGAPASSRAKAPPYRDGAPNLSKLEYAQYLATAFSHLISRQQDQVGLALLSAGLADLHPPGGRATHIKSIQRAIETIATQPATDLATGLRDLFQRLTRRGVLVVMSDFLVDDLDPLFAAARLFRHKSWEIVLLHLIHPDEERLPPGQAYRFEGMENDGRIDASPQDVRAMYVELFEAHCRRVREMALASGCDYRRVSTATPYLETLGEFLVERSG